MTPRAPPQQTHLLPRVRRSPEFREPGSLPVASPSWCVTMATVLSDFLGQFYMSCSLIVVHMILDIKYQNINSMWQKQGQRTNGTIRKCYCISSAVLWRELGFLIIMILIQMLLLLQKGAAVSTAMEQARSHRGRFSFVQHTSFAL